MSTKLDVKTASAPQRATKCAQLQISAAYTMCSATPFNRYGRNVLCNNDFISYDTQIMSTKLDVKTASAPQRATTCAQLKQSNPCIARACNRSSQAQDGKRSTRRDKMRTA